MCIFTNYNSYIDNDIAEFNQNDAIGVFYNNQCIGWAYIQESITIIPTIGNDGQNPQYPSNGDIVDFFIYDDSKNQILEAHSLNDLPNWQVNTMPNISQLISCSYNLPINNLGECIESCNYDVNQNNNVDILDILEIINQNILCNDCNFYFGKHGKSKFNCPRCGLFQKNPQIFSRVEDSNTLHSLVSELNIPEELRNDFKDLNEKS